MKTAYLRYAIQRCCCCIKKLNCYRMSNARYLPRANERYPLIAEGVIGVAFRRFGHHPRTGKGALTGMGQRGEKVLDRRTANKMTLGEAVVRGILRALTYGALRIDAKK